MFTIKYSVENSSLIDLPEDYEDFAGTAKISHEVEVGSEENIGTYFGAFIDVLRAMTFSDEQINKFMAAWLSENSDYDVCYLNKKENYSKPAKNNCPEVDYDKPLWPGEDWYEERIKE